MRQNSTLKIAKIMVKRVRRTTAQILSFNRGLMRTTQRRVIGIIVTIRFQITMSIVEVCTLLTEEIQCYVDLRLNA